MKHLVISETLHALLKRYCRERGLVMQKLVDDIIEEFLDSDEGPGAFRVSDPRVVVAHKELNRIRSLVVDELSKGRL